MLFLLTFILFANVWYLDANSEGKMERKIFFPFVVWTGKTLIVKTVFFLSSFGVCIIIEAQVLFK